MPRRNLDPAQIKKEFGVDVRIYNDYDKFLDDKYINSGDVAHHPYREQFTAFAESLDTGKEGDNQLKNTFETHRVIYAADKSAATGKPVSISEFKR